MIFNSLAFLIFIGFFLPLYFVLKGRDRLWLSLIGSYFFYGWWDWRFLSLIMISTAIDYFIAWKMSIEGSPSFRKWLLSASVVVNLGILGFFKYFNFFVDSFDVLLSSIGLSTPIASLSLILPVGISFYTFQSMSYTIDVYRGKLMPEKDWLRFATYISFFPQLVAGPIVRAKDFLPQFRREINFDENRFILGLSQVLWGFFKKVAVADSLAPFVDLCFENPAGFGSMHLLVGIVFYAFQIYCDFSGYSDIAIGLARMMGFNFPKNFNSPYFSKSFSEFWTRWHISLSSWLRDYLYIPLGGNRQGKFNTFRNLMITMLLGGLWHGAGWTFVFWGALHGGYLIIQRLIAPFWNSLKLNSRIKDGISMIMVFGLTCIAWVFFRASDFSIATDYLNGMFSTNGFSPSAIVHKLMVLKGVFLIAFLVFVEVIASRVSLPEILLSRPAFRVASFTLLLLLIAFLGTFDSNAFIYFQF